MWGFRWYRVDVSAVRQQQRQTAPWCCSSCLPAPSLCIAAGGWCAGEPGAAGHAAALQQAQATEAQHVAALRQLQALQLKQQQQHMASSGAMTGVSGSAGSGGSGSVPTNLMSLHQALVGQGVRSGGAGSASTAAGAGAGGGATGAATAANTPTDLAQAALAARVAEQQHRGSGGTTVNATSTAAATSVSQASPLVMGAQAAQGEEATAAAAARWRAFKAGRSVASPVDAALFLRYTQLLSQVRCVCVCECVSEREEGRCGNDGLRVVH